MDSSTILEGLLKLRDEHAKNALQTPQDKTEFGYGMVSGRYQGLVMAIQLIERGIEEEDAEEARSELEE